MPTTYVVVGAGLAGATAAATLRAGGFDGELILIGDEWQAPYERARHCPRSTCAGRSPLKRLSSISPRSTRTTASTPVSGCAPLESIPWTRWLSWTTKIGSTTTKLLVATGSRNRRLAIAGHDLEGVYGLRTVADSDLIRKEAVPGHKAVVIGMGFIGCEVAASLRQLGVEVAAVLRGVPLRRVLGEEIGRVIEGMHRDNGVEMFVGDSVAAMEGDRRVERVTTKLGRSIDCDFVVVGVGAEPVTELLQASPVEIDNGIVVDEYCRTNVEGIYAAGDVANHYHPVFERHIRVEHFDNAQKQGAAAARTMLGDRTPYDDIPWFWSDQYEYNLQYFGFAAEWDELVVRGGLEQRDFAAFYLQSGRLVASAGIDRGRDLRRSAALIKARASVAASELSNDQLDLRSLVPA